MPAFYDVPAWRELAEKRPAELECGEVFREGVRYLPLGEEKRENVFAFPETGGVPENAWFR